MLTQSELLRALAAPAILSLVLALIALWRKWPWAFPLATLAGFLLGYGLLGLPKLPPADGTDWLFWLAVPVAALAVLDTFTGPRLSPVLTAIASAGVTFVILRKLPTESLAGTTLEFAPVAMAGVAALVTVATDIAGRRAGSSLWATAALAIVTGGAGVLVMSSESRTIGLHGLALAAAVGPVALLGLRHAPPRTLTIVTAPLLVGVLVSGRFYAAVTPTNFWLLLAAPLTLLIGAALPGRRNWPRGLIALLAVAIAAAAVTAPVALKAKRAAESDGYADYAQPAP